MRIKPIINGSMQKFAENNKYINKSLLLVPMLLAVSAPNLQADDVFTRTTESRMDEKKQNTTDFDSFVYNVEASDNKNSKNENLTTKELKTISKLQAKQYKYEEKLRAKEDVYRYYNTLLNAINGEKESKKKILAHVQENSGNRDLAVILGFGAAGVVLGMVTSPVSLVLSMAGFFVTGHVDEYVADRNTHPMQKQEVVNKIEKIENEINEIKDKVKTIQFEISKLK